MRATLPVLLYLLTAIATAIPVLWMMSWAVWGSPTNPTEQISLIGSVILLLAAFVSLASRRLAAPIALAGALAVWSCYLPLLVGIIRVRLSTQDLQISVFRWSPSSSPLKIQEARPSRGFRPLSPGEIQQIRRIGITGSLLFDSGNRSGFGKKSHAILILQKPVSNRVELRLPDATTVIYVQEDKGWKMFPSNARLLKRRVRLQPEEYDPTRTWVEAERAYGAWQGFGISWPKAALGAQAR